MSGGTFEYEDKRLSDIARIIGRKIKDDKKRIRKNMEAVLK